MKNRKAVIYTLILTIIMFSNSIKARAADKASKKWSAPVNGLSMKMEFPGIAYTPGEKISATLRFKNMSDRELKIFFMRNEMHRGANNQFFFTDSKGKFVFDATPKTDWQYSVKENDFITIAPGKTLVFNSSLPLDPQAFKDGGDFELRWKYYNNVVKWVGDGDNIKTLFEGREIPGIWTGSIEIAEPLRVKK